MLSMLRTFALVVAVLAPATTPDVIAPGHRRVQNELQLEWGAEFAHLQFVASPTRGLHGHERIRPGEPFAFSQKYGTRIHALPHATALPPPGSRMDESAGVAVPVPVAAIWSVPTSNPLARVVTTLRVVAVTDATIGFERLGERCFTAGGSELHGPTWLPLLAICLGGAAWLWWIGRRRRAAPAAAVQP